MSAQKAIEYEYVGRSVLTLDDHHPTLEVDFEKGDKFTLQVVKNEAHIRHEAAPREVFKCLFNDKLYVRLMRNVNQTSFVFVPNPKNPSYPMIPKMDKDMLEMLYDYFNERFFNSILPDSRQVVFRTSIPKDYTQPAAGLMESMNMRRNDGALKRRYRVSVDKSYNDPFVFVDVLLHEMIHVYQGEMAVRNPAQASRIFAGNSHGDWFQKEMRRINKDGFNIDTVLNWEKRDSSVTSEHFLIGIHMAVEGSRGQKIASSFWYWHTAELDNAEVRKLVEIYAAEFPEHEIFVTQHRTSSSAFRQRFGAFPKRMSKTMPRRAIIFRLQDVEKTAQRHIESELFPATVRDFTRALDIPKSSLRYMTGTYDEYLQNIKTRKVSDFGSPERAYQSVKISDVAKAAEDKLIKLGRLIAMQGREDRIRQDAEAIRMSFSSRFSDKQYVPAIRKVLAKLKLSSNDVIMELLGV